MRVVANRFKDENTNTHRPPGYIKVTEALKSLLAKKDFNAITWAEIAQTAEVNEGLIYKYFKDKRNLLHCVLDEYLYEFLEGLDKAIKGIRGSLNKLRRIAWYQLDLYNTNKVFARILLLEVRNYPGYFSSNVYKNVQYFSRTILDIINEGIDRGEIRNDISPKHIRQVFLGAIEHICLPAIIFNKELSPDVACEDICKMLFEGFQNKRNT